MNKSYIPVALLLMGIGLIFRGNSLAIPDSWNPLNWFFHGPVTVCIIEETSERSKLPATQLSLMESTTFPAAIMSAGGIYLGCFDKDVVDRDKNPPKDLVPFLDAAGKEGLPKLVYKRGSKITATILPIDEKSALEKLK